MGLFGRRKPLHRRLAEEGGLVLDGRPAGTAAQPPGWFGEARGEPGIHGLQRTRRWDTVTAAEAPALRGDAVHFVALPDGTLVVDEDEPDGALAPLADALERALAPPYRAEAIRRGGTTWGVAGSAITLVEAPGLEGEEVELVSSADGRMLRVDGQAVPDRAPALDAIGAEQGPEYVVRGRRVDGDLWEVEATPL